MLRVAWLPATPQSAGSRRRALHSARPALQCQAAVSTAGLLQLLQHEIALNTALASPANRLAGRV